MKTTTVFKLTVDKGEDAVFHLELPQGVTWGKAIDAAYEFLLHVNELAKKDIERLKQQESAGEQEPKEVVENAEEHS